MKMIRDVEYSMPVSGDRFNLNGLPSDLHKQIMHFQSHTNSYKTSYKAQRFLNSYKNDNSVWNSIRLSAIL